MSVDLREVSKLYDRYRSESTYVDLAIDCANLLPALITEIQQLQIERDLLTAELKHNTAKCDFDADRKERVRNMFP